MAGKKDKDDISKLSFEESIKRLKETVEKIEQGTLGFRTVWSSTSRGWR